jgi:hypothetical protein
VPANKGVHANKDSSSDPCLRHARGGERILQRKNFERLRCRWKHAALLVLQKGITEQNRLVSTSVGASTESCGDAIDAQACVDLVCDGFAALGKFIFERWGVVEGD